jgi:MerR family mercuric resistance operon transcriptional regulator
MINDQLTIGALAKASDVNVETIRYYQRIGLLPTPERSYGSIRRYNHDSLKRVRFIKRAQRLGFSLDEVRLLLGLADGTHCTETRSIAQHKLVLVEDKLADLMAIQTALKHLILACENKPDSCGCPIIDSLNEADLSASISMR